jgi:ABC-type dipeptide/oligopeptide/nickel transport system permease component
VIWFISRRFLGLILTLWIVFTLSFLLMHAVPGGPYSSDRNLPPEIEENFKEKYQLNLPIREQYWNRLREVARGDMGLSQRLHDFTVNDVIVQGLPVSACLGILALTFAVTLGLTAGIASALYRGSVADVALMSIATVGIAMPSFVIGGLSIILFVFVIPIFPAAGWGTLRQLVLPAICLGSVYAAEMARITRTGMLDALSQDFVRTARAKGLSDLMVALRHALPTALLPVVSFLGPAVAGILTGSVVIERIFAIPGLGWHFVQAATQRDLTLSMGLVLVYTLLLYTMNFLVDLSYGILDPRVELK